MECPKCEGRTILKWTLNKYGLQCQVCGFRSPFFETRERAIEYTDSLRSVYAEGLVPCPNCHPDNKLTHPEEICETCKNEGKVTPEIAKSWWFDFDYFVLGHFNEKHTEEAYRKENEEWDKANLQKEST